MKHFQENEVQKANKCVGIAAILSSIPKGIYYIFVGIFLIFVGIAVWYHHDSIEVFVNEVLIGCLILLCTFVLTYYVKLGYRAFIGWNKASIIVLERQKVKEQLEKARIATSKARLEVDMGYRYLPQMIEQSVLSGKNYEYLGFKSSHHLSNLHMLQSGATTQIEEVSSESGQLPTYVRYEDIRHQVPQGHVLIGIGPNGIETRDSAIGACVWIVGLSGTGKTSTTVVRVEERVSQGHQFLGVDPHWFKDDSLSNAISGYATHFLKPMARDTKEILEVLHIFLDTFKGRKSGKLAKPWKPITLLVDEVGSLMDATSEEEKEIKELLPSIARICGQEARNFHMGGIFISQQATMLAWLRKVALLVIVHQLLMESEKRLALNGDTEVIEAMKTWPIGRTYVYGVGFGQEGPMIVQQPYFEKRESGLWVYPDSVEEVRTLNEPLPFPVVGRQQNKRAEDVSLPDAIRYWNETYEGRGKVPTVKEVEARYALTNHQARRLINEYILQNVVNE